MLLTSLGLRNYLAAFIAIVGAVWLLRYMWPKRQAAHVRSMNRAFVVTQTVAIILVLLAPQVGIIDLEKGMPQGVLGKVFSGYLVDEINTRIVLNFLGLLLLLIVGPKLAVYLLDKLFKVALVPGASSAVGSSATVPVDILSSQKNIEVLLESYLNTVVQREMANLLDPWRWYWVAVLKAPLMIAVIINALAISFLFYRWDPKFHLIEFTVLTLTITPFFFVVSVLLSYFTSWLDRWLKTSPYLEAIR